MAMEAFGIAMTIGMLVVGPAKAGYDASKQLCEIKDQIKSIKGETEKYKEEYNNLLGNISENREKFIEEAKNYAQNVTLLKHQMELDREIYDGFISKVELYSIIFICIVFFAYLLKMYGVSETFYMALTWPFRTLWNFIVSIFKKK